MKIAHFVIRLVTLILLLSLLLILFAAFSPGKPVQLLRVMSGSMEPAIKVGSLVLVRKVPISWISSGDVINFRKEDGNTVIHRVLDIKEQDGKFVFITKGDINNSPDVDPVKEDAVLGKVILTVPYLGYISAFTHTRKGFVLTVILPASVIITYELWNIKKEYEKILTERILRKGKEELLQGADSA